MDGPLVLMAFTMGIISASTLLLGAINALFWRPGELVAASLVAFGGGALLAALTIDLVAPAFERGNYYALAAGCMLGGILFVALNEVVNHHGGFLRKASTTLYHLQRHEHRRFMRILSHLRRTDIFQDLSHEDHRRIASMMHMRDYRQGDLIFHMGDPADALYIIDDGTVELRDPQRAMECFETLGKASTFGRMALLTGMPYATLPVATSDTRVWILHREEFGSLLESSSQLRQAVYRWLLGDEVSTYLQERQHLDATQAAAWIDTAVTLISSRGRLPPPAPVERREAEFLAAAGNIRRFPLLDQLTPAATAAVAARLLYKHYRRGDTFYRKDDPADRMYVIASGEVALVHAHDPARKQTLLHDYDAFGSMAFLTGTRHTSAAVATQDSAAWVLRRQDFLDLLQSAPEIGARIRAYLQQRDVATYLERGHGLDSDRVMHWIHSAARDLDAGKLTPASAAELEARLRALKGAPLAIWLGILLDGIPESLVIGASLVSHEVSLALIAGLFLSNYPEALFSSIGMRQQGFPAVRIITMWGSLVVLTGVGAAAGSLLFVGAGSLALSFIEGIAAGSMLTMIAQTMLPDAYIRGGPVIGLVTLTGFLAALFFKNL